MPIGGVVINFMADAKKAVSQIRDLGRSLEDMDDDAAKADTSLGKVATEIDQAGDKARQSSSDWQAAETGLDGVGDEAEQTADRLRRSATEMSNSIRTAGNNIEADARDIKGDLGEAGRESGAEFIGNIAEGIGSGQANLNDVVTGTLGGLTNLAASLTGPVGIAAGAAAAGIGLVFAATKAEAEKAKARLEGIIGVLDEVGDASSGAAKQALWQEWLDTMKESPDQLQKIIGALQTMGIDTREWQEALTGNETAAKRIHDQMTQIITDIDYQVVTGQEVTAEEERRRDAAWDVRKELERQNTALGQGKDYQSDLEWLTKGTAKNAKEWADNTALARTEAQRTRDILDALNGKDVRIDFVANYTGKESDWNPAARANRQAAGVTATAAAPVTVNVYSSGAGVPNSPRALINMLETHQTRMGRKPGTPRAVAW